MDAIESFDWRVNAHFQHQKETFPQIMPVMQVAYYLSSYVGIGVLLAIAVTLFLVQKKWRGAVVALISVALAVAMIEGIRWLVPRRRPEDAANWLGPDDMLGSYPTASVFLFMLMLLLIGFALWPLIDRPWHRGLYTGVAALLFVWVFMSQFFLATHFLTDNLGGMAGAALIGWGAYQFLEPTERRPEAQE